MTRKLILLLAGQRIFTERSTTTLRPAERNTEQPIRAPGRAGAAPADGRFA
jgi:hypothetical protein